MPDVEVAQLETFDYIEGYYNWVRRHSSLGNVSPEEYERKYVEERAKKTTEPLDRKKGKGEKLSHFRVPIFRTTSEYP